MTISSDEEVRLRCIELAQAIGPKRVLQRAREYHKFVKGDLHLRQPQPPPTETEGRSAQQTNFVRSIRPS